MELEYLTFNQGVTGSRPVRPTKLNRPSPLGKFQKNHDLPSKKESSYNVSKIGLKGGIDGQESLHSGADYLLENKNEYTGRIR